MVVEALVTDSIHSRSSPLALTPRERDVLAQIAQGKSNAAVGAALFLSERTDDCSAIGLLASAVPGRIAAWISPSSVLRSE